MGWSHCLLSAMNATAKKDCEAAVVVVVVVSRSCKKGQEVFASKVEGIRICLSLCELLEKRSSCGGATPRWDEQL